MYPVPTICPICHDNLTVTQLSCRNCNTSLEGHFEMERIFQLPSEQLHFIEVFLRCEGKIGRVQEELGVSYPTVRSRLDEIIRALGYEVKSQEVNNEDQRQEILEKLARKEISSEEAFNLLEQL
ncbi:MAG TPA: DUF2089 domain-containing protein [Chloroflexi bacterium]|nr:DUF2089 domain-containing protein [Chloroflexota bacterium]